MLVISFRAALLEEVKEGAVSLKQANVTVDYYNYCNHLNTFTHSDIEHIKESELPTHLQHETLIELRNRYPSAVVYQGAFYAKDSGGLFPIKL
jgi:hypothetical protein